MRNLALLLAPALLTGCMTTSAPPVRKVVFQCEPGTSIAVTFDKDTATLDANGVSARLTQQRTGSGIHYTGGGHDLRGKGTELTWTDAAGIAHQCKERS